MQPVLDPDYAKELLTLNADLINAEEHLLKAHGLKQVSGLLRVIAAQQILAVYL